MKNPPVTVAKIAIGDGTYTSEQVFEFLPAVSSKINSAILSQYKPNPTVERPRNVSPNHRLRSRSLQLFQRTVSGSPPLECSVLITPKDCAMWIQHQPYLSTAKENTRRKIYFPNTARHTLRDEAEVIRQDVYEGACASCSRGIDNFGEA
jgi:hypothetical protein